MVGGMDFAARARLGQSLAGELVIDAHGHLGVIKDYFVPQPEAARLVDCMDRYGIQRACIFAYAGVVSDFVYGNDLVAAAVAVHPDRFAGYATLNANYPEELLPELERCEGLGLQGIKLITAYQGHSEETERLFPVYDWANSHGKIILSHQWGSPEFLARMAARHPRVSFHIGHLNLAYGEVVRHYDNVYTTTTFVPWPGAIEQAAHAFGVEKMLFGSDVPDLDPSLNLGPLLMSRLSDEGKRLILGCNMERVLRDHA
jgi:predicted TIM-barrel fold metal-dependent hydrolase